jgi:N-ethylmaleimide reductase
MPHYPGIDETYDYLSKKLNALDIAYIHLVDHSSMEAAQYPQKSKIGFAKNLKTQSFSVAVATRDG